MPLRRIAVQNARRFHTATLCRFPIPTSSSEVKQTSSQHTAGNGMNEPGAYKSGPTAAAHNSPADAQMLKDHGHGQATQPNKYTNWNSADSDSTVGIQSLNRKAATGKKAASASPVAAEAMDSAKATAKSVADKVKSAVKNGADSATAGDLKSTISNVMNKAKETLSDMTHKVTDATSTVGHKVSDTASTVSHKLQDTKQNVTERATKMGNNMEKKFESFAEHVAASGEAMDARDAAPESDFDVDPNAKPIGQQPNPKDKNDVMEGVPGMTNPSRSPEDKTKGMTDSRRGGQM